MELDNDVHPGTARFTHRPHSLDGHAELVVFEQPEVRPGRPLAFEVEADRVDLHAGVAVGLGFERHLGVVLGGDHRARRRAPVELNLARVGAQLLVGLTTEQLVDRHAECLALQIPQCVVDCRHGPEDDPAAAHAPERLPEELLPDRLDPERILADDELGEVLGHAELGLLGGPVSQPDLAEAEETLVGVDPDDSRVPGSPFDCPIRLHADDVHTRDLHALSFL